MSIKVKRTHIKYFIVTIPFSEQKKEIINNYYFTLVTDNFNIISLKIRFLNKNLNKTIKNNFYGKFAQRLKKLLAYYDLDQNTRIFIDKKINNKIDNPVFTYLFLIKTFCKININVLKDINKMIKRIDSYYKILKPKKYKKIINYKDNDIYFLWKELIRRNTCPWVTKELDQIFKTLSFNKRKENITIRIIILYLFISNMLYNKFKKYKKNI